MTAGFDPHLNLSLAAVAVAPVPATSGNTLQVTAGLGTYFPNPASVGAYNCTVYPADERPSRTNAEIVRVTARSTDTFTILRAQEGSTARAIVAGDLIFLSITSKLLNDVETAVAALQAAVTAGAATVAALQATVTAEDAVLQAAVDAVEVDVSALQSSVSDIEAAAAALQADVDADEIALAAAQADVVDHEGRIVVLETAPLAAHAISGAAHTGTLAYSQMASGGDGSGLHVPTDDGTSATIIDVADVLASYQTILTRSNRMDAPVATQLVMLSNQTTAVGVGNAGAGIGVFRLDPAWYTVPAGFTLKANIVASCVVNATAPTTNIIVDLFPITATAGTTATVSITLGATVQTITFTTPTAQHVATTGDFTFPTADYYVFGARASGSSAAGSSVAVTALLRWRMV